MTSPVAIGAHTHAMPQLKRVTVVNDSPDFLALMADLLMNANYPATLIDGDRPEAKKLVEASQPEILIIDLRLGTEGLSGLEILRWAREHTDLSRVPTIVCTADHWGVQQVRAELDAMGSVSILLKPFSVDDLYQALGELAAV